MTDQTTDAELYARIKSGEKAAYAEFYTKYEKQLYQYIFHYLKNQEQAEEVFQEVMMKILSHAGIKTFEDSLRGWLFLTARNACLNRIRKKNRGDIASAKIRVTQNISTDKDELETEHINKEMTGILQEKIQELPEEQQKVLELRLQGLNNLEISEKMNIPEGTVKSRYHTLVRSLRKGFST